MLDLMPSISSIPDHAPPSSYRSGKSVRVVRCGRILRAIKKFMAKSGLNLDEFAPHSLRIIGATTIAAGGYISEQVTQGERRWKSNADKAYTRNNIRGFEKGVT